MTTLNAVLTQARIGDPIPTAQQIARNPSAHSENRIHSDEVARAYGFRGGLVPGATTYAYLAAHLSRLLGPDWVARGSSTIALVRPVYDGDQVTIGGEVSDLGGDASTGSIGLHCWVDGPDGTRCAPGSAMLTWGTPVDAEPRPAFADPTLPSRRLEDRGILNVQTALVGQPLPPVRLPADAASTAAYLDEIEDGNPIFRTESPFGGPLVHPGWYPSIANRVLSLNYVLDAWMHTRSEIRHLAPARVGGTYTAYGMIVDAYEKRGHEYVSADVLICDGEDQPVARMLHTAIVVVAKR